MQLTYSINQGIKNRLPCISNNFKEPRTHYVQTSVTMALVYVKKIYVINRESTSNLSETSK